jgi:hypothetical protein
MRPTARIPQALLFLRGSTACGVGSGLPTPRRRTLATNILFFARSDAAFAAPSWLRSAAYAGGRGMGSPSLSPWLDRFFSIEPGHATDTTGMMRAILMLVCVSVGLGLAVARAGDHGHACKPTAGGSEWCGTGCGPRYCGEKHEPSCPDPCDACNRWQGCNGAKQMPDMLAPWQLPPGRGFRSGTDVGYWPGPCGECGGRNWLGRCFAP